MDHSSETQAEAGHRGAGHALDLTYNTRLLGWALAVTVLTMLVEGAGGFISGSLALLADAGHMLTDVAALGLSLFAFWLSARPRTTRHTFGWRRFEIFAAFLNGVALWGIAVVIAYEAYQRFKAPPRVRTGLMLVVALLGLASNVGVAAILSRGRKRNLNLRGAFLHVLSDGLGSVGVLAAAVIIRLTGAPIWDPIVSAAVCLLILWSSGRLIKESFHILMEAAPRDLDIGAVSRTLAGLPGVVEVHDLHVWTITSEFISLSAHLKIEEGRDPQEILRQAREAMASSYGISHTTFQLECAEEAACPTQSCGDECPAERGRER
jgi:cobalt-zinc-cadmium efflux system protein